MKLSEKYPNTPVFQYFNANPKKRITTDCVERAVCTGLDIPYNQVVMEMAETHCQTGYDPGSNEGINLYLKTKGWVKHNQPKKENGKKYTGKEFCKNIAEPGKRYIANIGGNHIVAIVNCKVYDIWDSTDCCIGIYWAKE